VVAFYPATSFPEGIHGREARGKRLVEEIRAATRGRPDFIEAWVLNWGLEMGMLQDVQERLGPDYVCVRPDVLVDLRRMAGGS
jgi:hypothetical protein